MLDRMKRVVKVVIVSLLGVVALGALGIAGMGWIISSGCANTIQARVRSPDGAHEAIVFERDCGATTDYSTQVAVVETGEELPNDPGNAYIAAHRTPVEAHWHAPAALDIRHPTDAPSMRGVVSAAGVAIRYVPVVDSTQ